MADLAQRIMSARQSTTQPKASTAQIIGAALGGLGGFTASENPVLAKRKAEKEALEKKNAELMKSAKAQVPLQIQTVKDIAEEAGASGRFRTFQDFAKWFMSDVDPDNPGSGMGGRDLMDDIALNMAVAQPELSAEQARVKAVQMVKPALQAFVSPSEAGAAEGRKSVAEAREKAAALGGTPEERQGNFARLMGITPEKQGEFLTLLDALKDTPPNSPERAFILGRVNKLSSAEGGVTITADKDGNVRVQLGGGGGAEIPTLTGSKLDELRAQTSATNTGLSIVSSLLKQVSENPGIFGATGTVRGVKETIEGIVSDAANSTFSVMGMDVKDAFEGLNSLIEGEVASDDVKNALRPSSVGEMAVFEGILRYAIARTLQPEGRLLKDTVEQASSMAQLTGLTSSRQVRERLMTIQQLLQNRLSTLQRRMQQGVQGTTDVPVESPVAETPPASQPTAVPRFRVENGKLVPVQ